MSSKTKWMGLGTVVMACVAGACTNVEGGAARDGARDPREESGTKPPVSVVAEDFGSAEGPRAAYDGKGFVVHEWGTDTLVVGSDGSLQVGLHHEEEDLPPFVEDRLKAGAFPTNVEVKMETPVTYFYADRPLSVEARVRFPKGAFTQWFPRAQTIAPKLVGAGAMPGVTSTRDGLFDPTVPFERPSCRDAYGSLANGVLDWGRIEVLPRDAKSNAKAQMPAAPLEKTTWSFARNVDSNAVRSPKGDIEQFLFYRGLGSFEPPVKVTTARGGNVRLTSSSPDPMGAVFVIDVGPSSAAFRVESAIAANGVLETAIPKETAREPFEVYEKKLGDRVADALEAQGLFHDEAVGMVNTWKRQWFRTPGARVLYLLPESFTNASIPLEITPAPDRMRRVMLMRVELLTPEIEDFDVARARDLEGDPSAVGAFVRMGRFGEPRLRRALAILGGPAYGNTALATVSKPGLASHAQD